MHSVERSLQSGCGVAAFVTKFFWE